uniref:Uncharacterized protein n=1 Tax=Oryza rufipogon TaxID=4529 RepID=A0A0E0NCP8_ORYRU
MKRKLLALLLPGPTFLHGMTKLPSSLSLPLSSSFNSEAATEALQRCVGTGVGGGAWAMGAALQRRVGMGVGGGAWAMGGSVRVHAEDSGAWGWAWAAARGDRRRRRGSRVMRRRRAALRRALDSAGGGRSLGGRMATGVGGGARGRAAPTRAPRDAPAADGAEEGVGQHQGRTQLGAAGWRREMAEAARGRGLAPSGGDDGEQDGEDAPVEGGGGVTAAPLPLLHHNPASLIRGGAPARPPPWALLVRAASPCAKLAAHPSAELVARGRGWGEDVIAGGGRGGKEGGLGWGKNMTSGPEGIFDLLHCLSLLLNQKLIFYWLRCPLANNHILRVSFPKSDFVQCPTAKTTKSRCPVAKFAYFFLSM